MMTAAEASMPPDASDLSQSLEAIRKRHDLPALAVVVTKGGEICARGAVGVRKLGDPTPVTTNDLFHIGSNTKAMTATLAGKLIDDGKLRWGTTIGEVFPELKGKMNKDYETVTLEQLLTHRGGAPAAAPSKAWQRAWQQTGAPIEQRAEFVEAVVAEAPAAKPGTRYIYSNQGYAIAGTMIEKVAGAPWEESITEKLFKPLGMSTAGFGAPGTPGKVDQPWGHKSGSPAPTPSQGDNPPAIAPAGRVHCSLDDLARFTIFHMTPPRPGDLLRPETLARLQTPPPPPTGSDEAGFFELLHRVLARFNTGIFGVYVGGWKVLPRRWAGGNALMHAGSNTMWFVVEWLAPAKRFSVVVGTNIAGLKARKACDEVAQQMIQVWAE
jgi:CubicO group peptidase (beta-lactamase class C family)